MIFLACFSLFIYSYLNFKRLAFCFQFCTQTDTQQGSGILRDKTMAKKLIHIPNDNAQNFHFCRLWLLVETFGHSTSWINQSKSPKLLSQRIRERYYVTLGTSVTNSLMSPSTLAAGSKLLLHAIIFVIIQIHVD